MDKDEILEKAREESEGRQDEWEMDVRLKATRLVYAIGLLVAAFIMILDTAFTGSPNPAVNIIWASMFGVDATMTGRKLKNRATLWCGIVMLAYAVVMSVCYVISLATKGA